MTYREDVVAALDEGGAPLRAEVRTVVTTKQGKGILNMAMAWAGKRVVIVELPEEKRGRRRDDPA